jgi:glucose-1-phosphate adenylyltransferase
VSSNTGIVSRTLTFVLAGGNGKRLHPLTRNKPKPLVPFGGVFRVIDFTLSNCVNSNLRKVYLLTQQKHVSLHRYIEKAASNPDSSFSHERGGSLACLSPNQSSGYRGTADAVFQNMAIIERERPEFVLVLAADHIYKMDYTQLLRRHADSGADLTMAAVEYPRSTAGSLGVLAMNSRNEVIAFEEKPDDPKPMLKNPGSVLVSMGVYVFSTSALIKMVTEDAWRRSSNHDFGSNIIPDAIGRLRVCAYNFTAEAHGTARYWRDVGTIDNYYRSQMELLQVNSPFDPYNDALWPTYAFGESNVLNSALTEVWGPNSTLDSVVSRRSAIFDARVARSVISKAVRVETSAEIESSVLLPGVRVGRGARIRRAVIDEYIEIPDGTEIGYDLDMDRQRFHVSRGGIVVIPAGATIVPDAVWETSGTATRRWRA